MNNKKKREIERISEQIVGKNMNEYQFELLS